MSNLLWANRGVRRVDVSLPAANVALVNQNQSQTNEPQRSAGVEANGGGASYGLDDHIYQRLLRERIVFLGSEVRDQNANAICAQLLLLSAEDPEADIFLHINSPGGSVDAGMAIYDTMNYIPNDVATVGMGLAASMGQFLLCAGTTGKRYALPHARIMMHQLRRHRRLRLRHPHPGPAEPAAEEAARRADRPPHRPIGRGDRARLRP